MRIGIFLSTLGGSPLQGGIERGLSELGHHVEVFNPGLSYDLVIVFNQTAHTLAYTYPQFPGKQVPIVFIDSSEYGYFKRLPSVIKDYANSFTHEAMHHDTKVYCEQSKLKSFLECRSFPYLIREFSKLIDYPANYHPIDYPLYCKSVEPVRPNRDRYIARQLELFCSWGASHPWRLDITDVLRNAHRTSEIGVIEQNGYVRMPQEYYFDRMKSAKCTVSYDGYGSGSFRMTEALVRTLLLQGPLSIKTRCPLVDKETCRTYDVVSDGEQFVSTDIADVILDALADPEGSYEIYERGYDHCVTHLSERATAQYVLDTVLAHDWTQETALEL